MDHIKLLDCTLRDGGYVNDWEFGKDNLVSIFERLVSSGVDIIEVGFLDQRREFDCNRSIMPDSSAVQKIYGRVDSKDAMIVGMIDYGTCGLPFIQPCQESYLDGIRVIFKKHLMKEAVAFCGELKRLGYQVFTQAVSITSYSDGELMELIGLVNELKPYAVSMVDTYGLLQQNNLMHYFDLLDKHLLPEIGIGYHSHNNFQLAFSNCIEMLKKANTRFMLVDGSLYGMGKSAGNAPTELLAMHMNERFGRRYDVNQLIEAIDGNIMKIYQQTPWGYNLLFYLAASNKCHPNYVQRLLNKHTLSIKSINEILDRITPDKKLLYDQEYLEELYCRYQKTECDDSKSKEKLRLLLQGKKILLLGPGKSIKEEAGAIKRFMEEEGETVPIAINFVPDDISVRYVFLSNSRRYIRLNNALKESKNRNIQVIATSNVTKTAEQFSFVLNNEALLDEKAEFMDNSFVMLLKVLAEMKVASIVCAGLDGYSPQEDNYANADMEYWFAKRKAYSLNQYVKDYLKRTDCPAISFLTRTYYQDEVQEK